MPLSTEIFVMSIFLAGAPFYYLILRDSELKGRYFFIITYIFLVLSNIATVVEELKFNYFFNVCEHLLITLSSITMLIAALQLTTKTEQKDIHIIPDE